MTGKKFLNSSASLLLFALTSCVPIFPAECEDPTPGDTFCEAFRRAATGCAVFYTGVFASLWIGDGSDLALTALPDELEFVLSQRTALLNIDHRLADVELGTVIGPSEQLDGCWSRFETRRFPDDSGEWLEAEFLHIDLPASRTYRVLMTGVDGNPCLDDSRPRIRIFDSEIVELLGDRYTVELGSPFGARTTGALNDDGSISFSLLERLGWEISIGHKPELLFTVDGDVLATSDLKEVGSPDLKNLWTRIDCSLTDP